MSYILDALKKAQADESPDGRAALALELKDRSRQRRWQYLVFTALLLNAGVLVYLFGPWPQGDAPTVQAVPAIGTDVAAGPEQKPAPVATAAPPLQPAAAPPPAAMQAERTAAASPPAAPAAPPRSSVPQPVTPEARLPLEPVNVSALPAAARARFPALDFSTHLYASDAELRAVVMNGQRLKEGERYGELELEEITETGVVLRFERYLVTVPVLDDWQ